LHKIAIVIRCSTRSAIWSSAGRHRRTGAWRPGSIHRKHHRVHRHQRWKSRNIRQARSDGHNFSSENASYANNVLTASDGTHTAQINFSGNYTLANFHFFSDGSGGTLVTDPPVAAGQGTASSSNSAEKEYAAPLTSGSSCMGVPDIAFSGISLGETAATLADWCSGHDAGGSVGTNAAVQDRARALFGQYMASSFATANEGHGDTPLADVPPDQRPHLSFAHAA
jgi:hypothetical protein